MKKKIGWGMLFLLFLISCTDSDLPKVNGMWQLKTIEDTENHTISQVDTIFYAFQRDVLFTYTVLYEKENAPATSEVLYGYVTFPSENKMLLELDERYHSLLHLTFWTDTSVAYDVLKLDAKNMVLSADNKIYSFIKY
ncbi:hypothetical protein AGMMS50262_19200 [Bacteroidia bacterium]|nr:hypothetical protein AGMMS50262_19200 [Bacteroidia bacterium]